MGVYFGFYAYKDKNSEEVDSIEDQRKVFSHRMLPRVPPSKEHINRNDAGYDDSEVELALTRYEKVITNFAQFGISEEDLDFLIHVDNSAYDDGPSDYFFDARKSHEKLIKFTDYFKRFEDRNEFIGFLDLETSQLVTNPVFLNGNLVDRDEHYLKAELEKNLSSLRLAIPNPATRWYDTGKQLNCEIVGLTLYEYAKKDIDAFASFFLKHADMNHFIKGEWR